MSIAEEGFNPFKSIQKKANILDSIKLNNKIQGIRNENITNNLNNPEKMQGMVVL